MTPYFTDEHHAFMDVVDKFVEKECSREYMRACDADRAYPAKAYQKLAELGWLGLTVPEEHGGAGADFLYRAILLEGLSRYAFDMGAVYSLSCLGIDTILHFGTDAQKRTYLEPALAGRIRFSVSMSEPDAGSDLTGIRLAAVDKGDHYLLNGQKVWASVAGADNNIILLVGRTSRSPTDRRHGLTMFLVPNDLPGLELRRLPTLSRHMTGTYECFYTDVKVPKENVLGPVDGAWQVLGKFLLTERIGMAAQCLGNTQTALNDAIKYAKQRKQFGHTIGSFQSIKHSLADATAEVDGARLLTYQAAWLVSRGVNCVREAAVAKLMVSEVGLRVTTLGMHVLGGYAQLPEFDMERYWRDAKQSTVSAGTSQIQRSLIGGTLGL